MPGARRLAFLLLLPLLPGCFGGVANEPGAPCNSQDACAAGLECKAGTCRESGGQGGATSGGGVFDITLHQVDDRCFDGAMEAIIQPEGPGGSVALPGPVRLPAMSDLPAAIDVDLVDPFKDVQDVPIERDGHHGMKTAGVGFPNRGVDLHADDGLSDPCLTDMTISAWVEFHDPVTILGEACLNVTRAHGDGCDQGFVDSAGQAGGCDVMLKLYGRER